jgi:hypothetical protein
MKAKRGIEDVIHERHTKPVWRDLLPRSLHLVTLCRFIRSPASFGVAGNNVSGGPFSEQWLLTLRCCRHPAQSAFWDDLVRLRAGIAGAPLGSSPRLSADSLTLSIDENGQSPLSPPACPICCCRNRKEKSGPVCLFARGESGVLPNTRPLKCRSPREQPISGALSLGRCCPFRLSVQPPSSPNRDC